MWILKLLFLFLSLVSNIKAQTLCVMNMKSDVYELTIDGGKTKFDRADEATLTALKEELETSNLGDKIYVTKNKKDPAFCCFARPGETEEGQQEYICRTQAQDLCWASKAKCKVGRTTFHAKVTEFQEFSCADLEVIKSSKAKSPFLAKTVVLRISGAFATRTPSLGGSKSKPKHETTISPQQKLVTQDTFACCKPSKDKTRFDWRCSIMQTEMASEINWQRVQITENPTYKESAAAQLNSINSLQTFEEIVERSVKKASTKQQLKETLKTVKALDLPNIVQESLDANQCSEMLRGLSDKDAPMIFLTLTNMMITQTKRVFFFHDKASLLSKSLLRSYVRFYVSVNKKTSITDIIDQFNKWWAGNGDTPIPLPEINLEKPATNVSCYQAETLLSLDLERLEHNNQMNERRKGLIMSGVHMIGNVLKLASSGAASAAAGPAAGAAAGAVADAVWGAVEAGIEKILERDVTIAKVRRGARSAIFESYQGRLYNGDNYVADCTPVVQDYLDVVYRYLTASESLRNQWDGQALLCIPELRINHLESYGRTFSMLNRMQGFKQRTYQEIETVFDAVMSAGDKAVLHAADVVTELRGKLNEIKNDAKVDAMNDKLDKIQEQIGGTDSAPSTK